MAALLRPTLLTLLAAAITAPSVAAQTLADLRAALEEGGGWVPVEVRDGRATLESAAIPTAGMLIRGYFQVWDGNPGTWTITASDPVNQEPDADPLIEVETRAGERVPFSRRTGMVSGVKVDVRWSEPGDTTLWLWVGLGEDPPPPSSDGPGGG